MSDSKFNLKHTLTTALITLLLTVLAGYILYRVQFKSPALNYIVASSPGMPGSAVFKRIFVVTVENTGSKEASDVTINLSLADGSIVDATHDASRGLSAKEQLTSTTYDLSIPSLNPDEQVTLFAEIVTIGSDTEPEVEVRGAGVTGVLGKAKSIWPLFLSGMGGVVVGFFIPIIFVTVGMKMGEREYRRKQEERRAKTSETSTNGD